MLRIFPLAALSALALAGALLVVGAQTVAFSDYEIEAEPAATALAHGHLNRFVDLAPAYGGSLVLRAPFALAAGAIGEGSGLPLYRALVLPVLLVSIALGLLLWRLLRDRSALGAWLALLLCVANPLSLRAIEVGHPEELLGGVLCVAAVLAAQHDRWLLAGVLLGLAGANKPWAVLAVLPVLLALDRDRTRCATVAGSVCSFVVGPLVVAGSVASSFVSVATARTEIFQPWQVFWFFGDPNATVVGTLGPKPDFRGAVDWAQAISHPAVVVVGLGLGLAWWPHRRREGVFALLSLVLLTRCMLDTWNTSYYALPFVLALLAHEVVGRRRTPWVTLVVTLGLWTSFELVTSPDLQAASFLLVTVPTWLLLAQVAFAPGRSGRSWHSVHRRAARWLPSLLPPVPSPSPAEGAPA